MISQKNTGSLGRLQATMHMSLIKRLLSKRQLRRKTRVDKHLKNVEAEKTKLNLGADTYCLSFRALHTDSK
jgi:hypothetical protein